jgi:hypothetical protein
MIRKHYGRPLELNPDVRRQRLLVRLVCLLFLVVFIGWVVAISATDSITSLNSLPPWIIIFGLLGVVCALGTIFVVLNAVRSWRTPLDLGQAARCCLALACSPSSGSFHREAAKLQNHSKRTAVRSRFLD